MIIHYRYIDTCWGRVRAARHDDALTGVWFLGQKHELPVTTEWLETAGRDPVLDEFEKQWTAYEAGEVTGFDLPLAPVGTGFQLRVWQALQAIEYGQTTTYGAVARVIGKASAVRAVGAAIGRNPLSVVIPCHRVLGSSGKLTGYAGGLERKQSLLRLEQGLGQGQTSVLRGLTISAG